MKEFSYVQKKRKEYYKKNRISMKIFKNIAIQKKKDSRFFIFKKILSDNAITECQYKLPRNNLYKLQDHRLFAQDGNATLQKYLREQFVYGVKEGEQNLTVDEFYLEIARNIEILDPNLAPEDKIILHDPSLEVF